MKCRKIAILFIAVIMMELVLSSCVNVRKVLGGSDADDKLFLGIKYENLEMIKEAVDDGADINHLKGIITSDTNPLWIAYKHVEGKNERVPEFLIKIGADVNYTSDGYTLLMWAASNTDVHDCEFLLSHGAKVDFEYNGYTALEYVLDNMGIASATEKTSIKSLHCF